MSYLQRTWYAEYIIYMQRNAKQSFILIHICVYKTHSHTYLCILQVELLFNTINNVLGNGVNILSLTGEGRESDESTFTPIKDLNVPYHLFSMVDICDTAKEITIEERVIVYYKYDNYPVNCVKIFRSAYRAKPFGFRYVQNFFSCSREWFLKTR